MPSGQQLLIILMVGLYACCAVYAMGPEQILTAFNQDSDKTPAVKNIDSQWVGNTVNQVNVCVGGRTPEVIHRIRQNRVMIKLAKRWLSR